MKKILLIALYLLFTFSSFNPVYSVENPPCTDSIACNDWALGQLFFTSSICAGCNIILTYQYSVNCQQYHIIGYTFSSYQCAECLSNSTWEISDIFRELEGYLLTHGALTPPNGESFITKVSQAACWDSVSNPTQPGGLSPCDSISCCLKHYYVKTENFITTYSFLFATTIGDSCVSPCFSVCIDTFFPKIAIYEDDNESETHIIESASYPNPANGIAEIRYKTELKGKFLFKLYNTSGSEILKSVNEKDSEEGVINIDLKNYLTGTYYYQIIFEGRLISTGKLTILK